MAPALSGAGTGEIEKLESQNGLHDYWTTGLPDCEATGPGELQVKAKVEGVGVWTPVRPVRTSVDTGDR